MWVLDDLELKGVAVPYEAWKRIVDKGQDGGSEGGHGVGVCESGRWAERIQEGVLRDGGRAIEDVHAEMT